MYQSNQWDYLINKEDHICNECKSDWIEEECNRCRNVIDVARVFV